MGSVDSIGFGSEFVGSIGFGLASIGSIGLKIVVDLSEGSSRIPCFIHGGTEPCSAE